MSDEDLVGFMDFLDRTLGLDVGQIPVMEEVANLPGIVEDFSAGRIVDLGQEVAGWILPENSARLPEMVTTAGIKKFASEIQEKFQGLVLFLDGFDAEENESPSADIVEAFGEALLALKRTGFPVVAAIRGRVGGPLLSMALHADRVVAQIESDIGYMAEAGLWPFTWGGAKEMLSRVEQQSERHGPLVAVKKLFELLFEGRTSDSAKQAFRMGCLRRGDQVVMSDRQWVTRAMEQVLALAKNYTPPEPLTLRLPGRGGAEVLKSELERVLLPGSVPEEMVTQGRLLAQWVCGGETSWAHPITEDKYMSLEREVFGRVLRNR